MKIKSKFTFQIDIRNKLIYTFTYILFSCPVLVDLVVLLIKFDISKILLFWDGDLTSNGSDRPSWPIAAIVFRRTNINHSPFGNYNQNTGITNLCTLLHLAPSISTHPHLAPCTSTQLISTTTLLHVPHFSLQSALSTLLELKYPRNWAISLNLGRKTQSCLFWLKIGTHSVLGVLIPNPDLYFWNFHLKIHFWVNEGEKSQSCLF